MTCCFDGLFSGSKHPAAAVRKASHESHDSDSGRERTVTTSDVDMTFCGGPGPETGHLGDKAETKAETLPRDRVHSSPPKHPVRKGSDPGHMLLDCETARRKRTVSNHSDSGGSFSAGGGFAGDEDPALARVEEEPRASQSSFSFGSMLSLVQEGAASLLPAGGKYILCTGGAGYIGSHTVVQLLNAGFRVGILDNLMNSSSKVMERIKELVPGSNVPLFEVDMLDTEAMNKTFAAEKFDAVIHFAGLKAVGESVAEPLWYYDNNLRGTINMLKAMKENGCNTLVFSSSATVYLPCETPLDEESPLGCSNPYGWTKFMIERILVDAAIADTTLGVSILRYFNPVGAHASGRIGEAPSSYPNNLMPFIQQVAVGRRECLNIFGTDYNTPDGTGVRDYIHVEDLAAGHICALRKALQMGGGCMIHNLGSGTGVSVKEMVKGFEDASGQPIPSKDQDRRPGDLSTVVANAAKAKKDFGWQTTRGVEDMCRSVWNWVSNNPYGYEPAPEKTA